MLGGRAGYPAFTAAKGEKEKSEKKLKGDED